MLIAPWMQNDNSTSQCEYKMTIAQVSISKPAPTTDRLSASIPVQPIAIWPSRSDCHEITPTSHDNKMNKSSDVNYDQGYDEERQ